jgi:DNA invertase Pin-like site-specific DNA recombinase
MLVGYARVSSAGQSLDIQREQLAAAGCERIFEEKKSGRKANDRPALEEALEFVREGDTLVITKLDRLARSMLDLHQIVEGLAAKRVGFRVLQQPVDTTTPTGELILGVLAAVAQFENAIRRERQLDGIAKAKAKGVYKGRKPSLDVAAVKAALASGESPTVVAKRLGYARSSVYRVRDAEASA